jgi:hypothetical protein
MRSAAVLKFIVLPIGSEVPTPVVTKSYIFWGHNAAYSVESQRGVLGEHIVYNLRFGNG